MVWRRVTMVHTSVTPAMLMETILKQWSWSRPRFPFQRLPSVVHSVTSAASPASSPVSSHSVSPSSSSKSSQSEIFVNLVHVLVTSLRTSQTSILRLRFKRSTNVVNNKHVSMHKNIFFLFSFNVHNQENISRLTGK